jgi:hypothetical protein
MELDILTDIVVLVFYSLECSTYKHKIRSTAEPHGDPAW